MSKNLSNLQMAAKDSDPKVSQWIFGDILNGLIAIHTHTHTHVYWVCVCKYFF